jgi:16S rRNA (cytosine1407-C5)-methyltransferase
MILVDAPCSSEGSISIHNEKFLESWDITHINKNYKRQKFIVSDIVPYLKDGGEFIYSTCTLSPEENEGLTHFLLSNFKELQLENIELEENKYIKSITPLKSFENKIFKTEISEKTIRVIPSEYSE